MNLKVLIRMLTYVSLNVGLFYFCHEHSYLESNQIHHIDIVQCSRTGVLLWVNILVFMIWTKHDASQRRSNGSIFVVLNLWHTKYVGGSSFLNLWAEVPYLSSFLHVRLTLTNLTCWLPKMQIRGWRKELPISVLWRFIQAVLSECPRSMWMVWNTAQVRVG